MKFRIYGKGQVALLLRPSPHRARSFAFVPCDMRKRRSCLAALVDHGRDPYPSLQQVPKSASKSSHNGRPTPGSRRLHRTARSGRAGNSATCGPLPALFRPRVGFPRQVRRASRSASFGQRGRRQPREEETTHGDRRWTGFFQLSKRSWSERKGVRPGRHAGRNRNPSQSRIHRFHARKGGKGQTVPARRSGRRRTRPSWAMDPGSSHR